MTSPLLVSVVMSVYNAEEFLLEAIESIINQTFTDFEFIIINDGSEDGSWGIIESYKKIDKRIVTINRENKGLIYSLNEGISIAKGKYIARMDADDISTPERLKKQVDVLEQNSTIGLVSTNIEYFSKNGRRKWPFFFQNHNDLKALMPFHSPIVHAAVLMRKTLFDNVCYESEYSHAEDYRLWTRLANKAQFFNIEEVLYLVREHDSKVSVKHNDVQIKNSLSVIKDYLKSNNVSVWDEALHKQIITTFYQENNLDLVLFLKYVNTIQQELNSSSEVFDWLKSIFIVNNTQIPKAFIFHLIFKEFRVIKKLSLGQILSLTKRSLGL